MFNKTPECYLLFFIGCKGKTINEKRSFSDRIFARVSAVKSAEHLFGSKNTRLHGSWIPGYSQTGPSRLFI